MNLTTRYLGLPLAHPIVASASPLTATLDGMRRLEDAGAAAIVMASLYEEQIRAEDTAYALYTEHGSNSQAEAGTYFPELVDYNGGVSGHLETLRHAADALDIPVIASLNGTTSEGWITYARDLEQAGAAALELNVYSLPVDPAVSGGDMELARSYLEQSEAQIALLEDRHRGEIPRGHVPLLVAKEKAAALKDQLADRQR